jgi:hypothetical protein
LGRGWGGHKKIFNRGVELYYIYTANNKGTVLTAIFPHAFHNNVKPISLNIMRTPFREITKSNM